MNTDKILAEAIAKDYAPKDNSKIVALKKLDKKAKLPATIFTYTFGIISALIVGTGMSLAMQAIGSGIVSMVAGIVIGVLSFLPFCCVATRVQPEGGGKGREKCSKLLALCDNMGV